MGWECCGWRFGVCGNKLRSGGVGMVGDGSRVCW